MDYLELKNLLSPEIKVVCGYNLIVNEYGNDDMGYYCKINRKYELSEFLSLLRESKERILSSILTLDSGESAKRILHEYSNLQKEFTEFELSGNKYLKFNNLRTYDNESFFLMDDSYLKSHKFSPQKQKEVDEFLKIKAPTSEQFLKLLEPVEVIDINQSKLAETVNQISDHIKLVLDEIVDFINLHFNQEAVLETDKISDRLHVKQQILLLHYLFTFYQSSPSQIPNNKLSLLLGKLLGRNSETIRGLLTQIPTVEDKETDNKIAKTPKNLKAVFDLLNSISIPQLLNLVEKDLRKIS